MIRLSVKEVRDIFAKKKAIITGDHFVYAKKEDGWYHGADYVNKDALYPFTDSLILLCREIALHFEDSSPECVVGPESGGAKLAQWTANSLSRYDSEVLALSAYEEDLIERKEFILNAWNQQEFLSYGLVNIEMKPDFLGSFGYYAKITFSSKIGTQRVIKGGQDELARGKRCLIVEDVINSGKTVKDSIRAIEKFGGIVVGVGALCNRSGGKVTANTLSVPEIFSLIDLDMKVYKEEECPICKERGVESVRTDIGKGKEFLIRIGKL